MLLPGGRLPLACSLTCGAAMLPFPAPFGPEAQEYDSTATAQNYKWGGEEGQDSLNLKKKNL